MTIMVSVNVNAARRARAAGSVAVTGTFETDGKESLRGYIIAFARNPHGFPAPKSILGASAWPGGLHYGCRRLPGALH